MGSPLLVHDAIRRPAEAERRGFLQRGPYRLVLDAEPGLIPGADGSAPSVKQALYMLTQFMLERSVSSTTVTVKKPDGSTTLFTLTLNSASAPTSITRAP